jgi:hypothetical protein
MIRKLSVLASLLVCLFTSAVHAQSGCYTNYIVNGGFTSTTAWTFAGGAYRESTLDDPCDIFFGYKMNAGALTVPFATVYQSFTTSSFTADQWSLSFEVLSPSLADATSSDDLRVVVQDLTVGRSETFTVRATQLTSTCQRFDFTLANDYSGHQVRVRFNAQPFSAFDFYVTNVAFLGRYC